MNKINWVEDSNKSVWNVCIKFDTWKNIEKFTVIEENSVKKKHVNIEIKSLEITI